MLDKIEDAELTNFIKEYDKCFLERNIEKLKSFYPEDDHELVYCYNHKNNVTYGNMNNNITGELADKLKNIIS